MEIVPNSRQVDFNNEMIAIDYIYSVDYRTWNVIIKQKSLTPSSPTVWGMQKFI